jgi:hypothetical protein
MLAAIVFTGLEVAVAAYTAFSTGEPFGLSLGVFSALSGACSALALATRFMAQKGYDDDA